MLSQEVRDALNRQVNAEIYSAYLYLSMSFHLESLQLRGAALWMRYQAEEEEQHAERIYRTMHERGARAELDAIEKPPVEWGSPLGVFESAYAHEQKVTAMINDLVDIATAESDHATVSFLKWFVDEQVEEEASASEVADKLRMIGDSKMGLYMLDKELGRRPAPVPLRDQAQAEG